MVSLIPEHLIEILKGLGNNILITFLTVLFPLMLGVGLAFLQAKFKIFKTICSWLSLATECICPPLLIIAYFYIPAVVFNSPVLSKFWAVVLALSACFIFYMPARYVDSYSMPKNLLYNGLGLISTVFKWSFLARIVMVIELGGYVQNFLSYGIIWPLLVALFITAAILLVLEAGRRAVKQFMK